MNKFFLYLLLISLLYAPLHAQINDVRPFVHGEELVCDVGLDNFFNEKVHSTILSGLPMDLTFAVKLLGHTNETILETQTNVQIHYDVWDEVFYLRHGGLNEKFSSLDELRTSLVSIKKITVSPMAALSRDRSYKIKIRLLIKQIGAEQSRSFWDWLNDNVEESPLEENGGTEFRFSLTALLQLFFGSEKNGSKKSDWYESRTFKLPQLPNQ